MRKRIKVRNEVFLNKYLMGRQPGEVKALVLKLVVSLGSVREVSELTGIPAPTIYDWIKKWNVYGKL